MRYYWMTMFAKRLINAIILSFAGVISLLVNNTTSKFLGLCLILISIYLLYQETRKK